VEPLFGEVPPPPFSLPPDLDPEPSVDAPPPFSLSPDFERVPDATDAEPDERESVL
jgi:hypothetical protein